MLAWGNPPGAACDLCGRDHTRMERSINEAFGDQPRIRPNAARTTLIQRRTPAGPVRPDGTVLLDETLLEETQTRTPVLGTCRENDWGERWCRASCLIETRKRFQRRYQIVNRERFVAHRETAARRPRERRDAMLGLMTLGIGNVIEAIVDPSSAEEIEQAAALARTQAEQMPEIFTAEEIEERRTHERYDGIINGQYWEQAQSSVCQNDRPY